MKLVDRIKKIFIALIALLVMTSGTITKADEEIQSGIYTLKNNVYHENETGMAMARSYVAEDMQVKITKEGATFTIGFSGTNFMNNYRIKVNDVEVPVEIIEENKSENTIKIRASAPSKDVKLAACIYVEPMGRDVEFQIIPDYSTRSLVEAIEEAPVVVEEIKEPEEDVTEVSATEETNIAEETNKSNNKMIIIGAVVLIVTGSTAVFFSKKKRN